MSDTIHLKWTNLETVCGTEEITAMRVYPWAAVVLADPNTCPHCLEAYRTGAQKKAE